MDKIVIKGGVSLKGEVEISGAKNAALPILAASLLAEGAHVFRNVPDLADVRTMCDLLAMMGCEPERGTGKRKDTITIGTPKNVTPEAPYDLVKTMRASVLVLGPLCARFGRARVSLPGGCAIGARPIDQHLKGLKLLGAELELKAGYVEARAKRLKGATINFDMVTVTGTENLMMAACLADGRTLLENAAREPEVEELALVLNKMGARISGAGTDVIAIEGVEELKPIEHAILPDRIEAGTFMVAAAITQGNVLLKRVVPEHLDAVIQKLRATGATVSAEDGGLRVKGPRTLKPVDLRLAGNQLAVIDQQISDLQGQLTGTKANPRISTALSEFEQLKLFELFNQRMYQIAQLSYDKARQEAQKQQLFLVRIVEPMLPEEPLVPKTGIDTLLFFIINTILWSIVSLLIASVRDHVE